MKKPLCLVNDIEIVNHYHKQIMEAKKNAVSELKKIEEEAEKSIAYFWSELEKNLISMGLIDSQLLEDNNLVLEDGVLFLISNDSEEDENIFKKFILNITK